MHKRKSDHFPYFRLRLRLKGEGRRREGPGKPLNDNKET